MNKKDGRSDRPWTSFRWKEGNWTATSKRSDAEIQRLIRDYVDHAYRDLKTGNILYVDDSRTERRAERKDESPTEAQQTTPTIPWPEYIMVLINEAILRRDADLGRAGARITVPPGTFLRTLSEFVFSKKTLEHVIDPIIADMQSEYCEALAAKRPCKAFWVRIRYYWSFAKTIGLYSILKTVIEMWRKIS